MSAVPTSSVHPIFQGILGTIQQAPDQIRRAEYVSRLRRMDWQFEHAPGEQWRRGRAELQALRELQTDLDPDAELWNRNAPFEYLITRSVKIVCDLPSGGREVKWIRTGMGDIDLAQHFQELHGIGTCVDVKTMSSNVAREVVA